MPPKKSADKEVDGAVVKKPTVKAASKPKPKPKAEEKTEPAPKPKPVARKKPAASKKPVDKDEDPENDAEPVKKPKSVQKKAAVVEQTPVTEVPANDNKVIKVEIQGVKLEISLMPGQGLAGANITDSNAANADAPTDPKSKPKNKKKTIPKCIRIDCWNNWIGKTIGETKCLCCGIRDIGQNNFECGHIISEAKGGGVTVDNLKPICSVCNKSMHTMNMDDFKNAHYPGDKKLASSAKKKAEPTPEDKRKEHIKELLANGSLTKCPGKKKDDTPLSRLFESAYGKTLDRSLCAKAWRDTFGKHCDECGNHFAWRLYGADADRVCPCMQK
jgi:hypothetical protein